MFEIVSNAFLSATMWRLSGIIFDYWVVWLVIAVVAFVLNILFALQKKDSGVVAGADGDYEKIERNRFIKKALMVGIVFYFSFIMLLISVMYKIFN